METKRQKDSRIDHNKITVYQRLVSALANERITLKEFGAFSAEAYEAELETRKARRNYNLWQAK